MKNFKNKILSTIVVVTTISGTVLPNSTVLAAIKTDTDVKIEDTQIINENKTREFLEENGVPKEKIDNLLEKRRNNEMWDCFDPEKLKEVPEDFDTIEINENGSVKYYRFEDGSFLKNELIQTENSRCVESLEPRGNNLVTARGVTNTSYGSQYTDYKISKSQGDLTAYFYADFWRARSGAGASQITNLYGEHVTGNYYTGGANLNYDRKTEDIYYGGAARASLSFVLTHSFTFSGDGISFNVPSGQTVALVLELRGGSMKIFWD